MKNIYLILLFLTLASCGYFGDEPIDSSHYTSEATTGCKTDPGAMSAFMTEILSDPINCLETNLNKYAEAVQRTNRNYIDKNDLEKFVRKFFTEEHVAKTLDSMELFYQLIRLILQDEQGRLSISNIPKIMSVLRVANKEFVVIYDVINNIEKSKNKGMLWIERERLIIAISNLCDAILELIENSPGHLQALKKHNFAEINLDSLLQNINKKLSSDKKIDNGILEIAMIGKDLLLGGQRHNISTIETTALLRKIPILAESLFDILYADDDVIKDYPNRTIAQNGMWSLYLARLRQLKVLMNWDNFYKTIITTDDIIMIIETLVDTSNYNLNNFRECIEEGKLIFLQGKRDRVTVRDLETLFSEAIDLVSTLYFNDVTYEHFARLMEKNEKIESLPGIVDVLLPEYRDIYKSVAALNTAKKEFEDIATMLRLYRTDDNSQYYKKDIIRTKYGFNETALVRFGARKLLKHFGSTNSSAFLDSIISLKFEPIIHTSEYTVTSDELFEALLAFKPLLQELDLWTLHPDTFASNTLLMADLFQVGSDADDTMNVTELSQYAQLILTTLGMSSDFLDKFENTKDQYGNPACRNLTPDEDEPSYEVDCYRKYVFNFMVDLNAPCENQTLSNLCMYAKQADDEEKIQFLFNVESFAREKGYVPDNVPMRNRDLILVLGTILNIESMIIRFDENKNNYLDVEEVNKTFKLYKNVIIKKAKLTGIKKSFAKSAYLYMVSNMVLPKTMPLLWYHVTSKKEVEATRKNVGALFFYFGNL